MSATGNHTRINTNATTFVLNGPGVLTRIIVNSLGASSNRATFYDAATLTTPTNDTFTEGVGTLATATYYYRVSALNAFGESLASTETSLAVTGPVGVNVNWNAITGATGYKVYGRTTGAEQLLATVGAVTTWLDDGSGTPDGALEAPFGALNTTSVIGFLDYHVRVVAGLVIVTATGTPADLTVVAE